MSLPTISDRYRALLQVNEIALTKSTTEELFQGMCTALKRLLPYDRAGLSLYDPDQDGLKIVVLYGRTRKILPLAGCLARTRSKAL